MPWCPGCDRFLSPATVSAMGECPRCGSPVDPGRARAPGATAGLGAADAADAPAAAAVPGRADAEDAPLEPLPWHFKLLAGALALYLGWRAVQGVEWLVRQF